jgi:hypothetical protein
VHRQVEQHDFWKHSASGRELVELISEIMLLSTIELRGQRLPTCSLKLFVCCSSALSNNPWPSGNKCARKPLIAPNRFMTQEDLRNVRTESLYF